MALRPLLLACLLILAACTASADGEVAWPLPGAEERPTPLSFGLYVTPDPEQNPIDPPERFTGYHAAVDFEILPGEEEAEVPVFAACDGEGAAAELAEGYGGLVTQRCVIRGERVMALYGHLSLNDLPRSGARLQAGDRLGTLAPARSADSGETRKHLHFGLVRGWSDEIRGYVQEESELRAFLDPRAVLPR